MPQSSAFWMCFRCSVFDIQIVCFTKPNENEWNRASERKNKKNRIQRTKHEHGWGTETEMERDRERERAGKLASELKKRVMQCTWKKSISERKSVKNLWKICVVNCVEQIE